MKRADRKLWRSATTLPELGELMAQWLEGRIASRPGYMPDSGPDPETEHLVPVLARLNRAGYVTEGSQPGEQSYCTCGDQGCHGEWFAQRAAVEGFADDTTLDWIRAAVAGTELTLIVHRPQSRREALWRLLARAPALPFAAGLPVTVTQNRVHTAFGSRIRVGELLLCFDTVSDEMFDLLYASWQVTVIDPEWGRDDLLWPVLDEAFATRTETR